MKKNKFDPIFIGIILLSILGTILIFKNLPGQIPMHWNIKGEVDDYSSKGLIYITAFLPLAIYILMKIIPHIDPQKDAYDKHRNAYSATMFSIIIFLIGLHWMTIGYALGYPLNMIRYIMIALGLVFIIIGNYMPQIKFNYFFGIRTPWTLSSEKVWRQTHTTGGYLYFIMGSIFILSSFFNNEISYYLSIGSVIVISIAIVIYSYLLYRKENESQRTKY